MKEICSRLGLATLLAFVGVIPSASNSNAQIEPNPSRTPPAPLLAKVAKAADPPLEGDRPSTTFRGDVLPILLGKCYRCHNNQTRMLPNWVDYKTAFADRVEIRRRVWDSWKGHDYKQTMPLGNSPESLMITEQERQIIRKWVDSGAAYGMARHSAGASSKPERIQQGKQIFATICAACHQPNALGIPGQFPPLAGSDFLNADKKRAINILLHGLQGAITVNGTPFNYTMPQLPLNDHEIACALTYVYNSFGNSGLEVTADEVGSMRRLNLGPNVATPMSIPSSRVNAPTPFE